MSISIPWNTGYALLIISGLFVWIGVPILNSVFGTNIMTSFYTAPIVGTHQTNVLLGGGLVSGGIISYAGFRL